MDLQHFTSPKSIKFYLQRCAEKIVCKQNLKHKIIVCYQCISQILSQKNEFEKGG